MPSIDQQTDLFLQQTRVAVLGTINNGGSPTHNTPLKDPTRHAKVSTLLGSALAREEYEELIPMVATAMRRNTPPFTKDRHAPPQTTAAPDRREAKTCATHGVGSAYKDDAEAIATTLEASWDLGDVLRVGQLQIAGANFVTIAVFLMIAAEP